MLNARSAAILLSLTVPLASAHAQGVAPSTDPGHHSMMMSPEGSPTPVMPGQDAFGTIQEILRILDEDPTTDWSKVNIDALREHLIDMNEITLHARAAATLIEGGVRLEVTGDGRTLLAVQRMVPAQLREIEGANGWRTSAELRPDGIALTVTAADATQAAKIRVLGFIGIMAQGTHHQRHHLAIARGELVP